ncbi:MAG: hypothetical protein R2728_04255 [Chitinophagales bacterium]
MNKLEVLLSQVNDTNTIVPAATTISTTNQQDYKQSIDSLKTAMDQRFNLLLEEIKNSKINANDSIVSTSNIDLPTKEPLIPKFQQVLVEDY